MYVRVICDQVRTLAPALLAGYRSPFTGASGADNPVLLRFKIPQQRDRLRRVHPGAAPGGPGLRQRADHHPGRHPGGAPRRAARRRRHHLVRQHPDKTLGLITAKSTDAVHAFLDAAYAERAIRDIEKRRAARRRPGRDGPHRQPAAAFTDTQQAESSTTSSAAATSPPRGHARRHQPRPDPHRRRRRLRDESAALRALELAATA